MTKPAKHSKSEGASTVEANTLLEVAMSVSFSRISENNPSLKGSLAAKKQFFGEGRRYAVAPVHTRFDAVEWFVWDAEHSLSDMSHAEVIRQEATLEEALRGL